MSKHTPGPWQLDGEAGIAAASGWVLAIVYPQDPPLPATKTDWDTVKNEAKANARLIAAAPELLEACKLAEKYFREMIVGPETHYPETSMLRAAIAKAEGTEK